MTDDRNAPDSPAAHYWYGAAQAMVRPIVVMWAMFASWLIGLITGALTR